MLSGCSTKHTLGRAVLRGWVTQGERGEQHAWLFQRGSGAGRAPDPS